MVSQPAHERGNITAFPARARVRETAKAAAAYLAYEAMPAQERSIRKLAESNHKYSKSVSLLLRWSTQHNWVERVAAYDERIAEVKRKKREVEIEQMDERQSTYGRASLASAVTWLTNHFANEATIPDAIRLMKVAYELERLARGAATSKVEADVKMGVLPKEYINISADEEGSEE